MNQSLWMLLINFYESIFVHAADQFFISEAAGPATNWDGGALSIL